MPFWRITSKNQIDKWYVCTLHNTGYAYLQNLANRKGLEPKNTSDGKEKGTIISRDTPIQ